jgi:cytochrome c556
MKKTTTLLLGLILSTNAYTTLADDYEAEDIIEYRQDVMEAIKYHNKAIKAILKGKVGFDDQLDTHMTSLEDALGDIGSLFPEGSDFGETSAKDAVWDKPEKFDKAVKDAQQAFADFKAVVSKGDKKASAKAFKEFGKNSCGSCHKTFKKKDDD